MSNQVEVIVHDRSRHEGQIDYNVVLLPDEGIIRICNKIGEVLKEFDIHSLVTYDEDVFDHECEECKKSHCDDGDCPSCDETAHVDVDKVRDLVDQVKHTFHELERELP